MGSTRKSATAQKPLPANVEEALVSAIAPLEPTQARAASIRARLVDRVRGDARRFVTVRTSDGAWIPLAPKVAMKMLDDDGAMQAFLLRFDPGARLAAHDHAGDEVCLVLEGSVRLGEVEVGAGDYHFAPAGSAHGEVYSANGALLFIRTKSGAIPHRPTR
jgi:quercetin dioxygenase-like cupin family protein